MNREFSVRAVHCDHRASDEEVYDNLVRATTPLERSWEKLKKAGRIALKFNMGHTNVTHFEGRRRELVDDAVCRADPSAPARADLSGRLSLPTPSAGMRTGAETDYFNYRPAARGIRRRARGVELSHPSPSMTYRAAAVCSSAIRSAGASAKQMRSFPSPR